MNNGILIRYGEIWLKKGRRDAFLDLLKNNVKASFDSMEGLELKWPRGRLLVRATDEIDGRPVPLGEREAELVDALQRVPGIDSFSPVTLCDSSLEEVEGLVVKFADQAHKMACQPGSFRVDTNRADKRIEFTSPELNRRFGSAASEKLPGWRVQLKGPDLSIGVELHPAMTCVFREKIPGAGGLPVGGLGRGLHLLSGGIDSPVAAWRAARRGLALSGLHFFSHPHSPGAARENVKTLARKIRPWVGEYPLYMCDLGPFQRHCRDQAPSNTLVVLYRRHMMRVAHFLAGKLGAKCLVTGDSLGQVASQTVENIGVIQAVTELPVLRPLLCMDKHEIILGAKKLGTYKNSILAFPEACSLFVPKNPETKARLKVIENIEEYLDWEAYVETCAETIELVS